MGGSLRLSMALYFLVFCSAAVHRQENSDSQLLSAERMKPALLTRARNKLKASDGNKDLDKERMKPESNTALLSRAENKVEASDADKELDSALLQKDSRRRRTVTVDPMQNCQIAEIGDPCYQYKCKK